MDSESVTDLVRDQLSAREMEDGDDFRWWGETACQHADFKSTSSACVGANDYKVSGNLSIRGVSHAVVVDMHYLGRWQTPYWTDAGDAGPVTRIGFVGEARINRQDFRVSWNGQLEGGGVVVSDEVFIKVDVEALLETELKRALQKGGAT